MLLSFSSLVRKYNMSISGVIHVGAHHGEEVSDYIRHGIQNIILFEPIKESFEILERNVSNLNANILGYQVALGNENKDIEIYLSKGDMQCSSILKPKGVLEQYPNIIFEGKQTVEMKKLDEYYDQCVESNFLNIDVQGYELEVLKGGSKTLEHVDYVYCEVNRHEVYENNAMIEEIDEYLKGYGFSRKETDWAGETWGDALYIKEV